MRQHFRDAGFFVVRTPLLPLDVLGQVEAGHASMWDDANPLARLVADPAVLEALRLASPSFTDDLLRAPSGVPLEPDLRRTLVRYLVRMSSRSTPLGLLAGCSWGRVVDGESKGVELVPREAYRRQVRVDVRQWSAEAQHVLATATDDALVELHYRTNPALVRRGGFVRLCRLVPFMGEDETELVEFPVDEPLRVVLGVSAHGVPGRDVVDALLDEGHADDPRDATAYLRAVAGAGLLVSELHPRMTSAGAGTGPVTHPATSPGFRRAAGLAAALDGRPLSYPGPKGQDGHWLADEAADFGDAPVVDLWKPTASAHLGRDTVAPLGAALDVLSRLSLWEPHRSLEAFTAAFVDRHDEQWELDTLPLHHRAGVPLVDALDPESGIPFGGGTSADVNPLIDALPFPEMTASVGAGWPASVRTRLLAGIVRCATTGAVEWRLTPDDLAVLATSDPGSFPDSASVTASRRTVDGEARWVLRGVNGPAAASRFARAALADDDLAEQVRRLCAREESERPDALVVDFVHQPPGRPANLAVHPSLRRHECELHGFAAGGAAVLLEDLRLTLRAGELVLFSASRGLEVMPRLPSSYNHEVSPFPVVRLLGALQHRRQGRDLGWTWAELDASPFLPRVVLDDVVLSPARWRVAAHELAGLVGAVGADAVHREVELLRERLRLPRWVAITHGDLLLSVDLESEALVGQLVAVARSEGEVVLTELHLDEDVPLVEGPEGRFAHEVVIPFVRPRQDAVRVAQTATGSSGPDRSSTRTSEARTRDDREAALVFPPGSRWLSTEIYCGSADVDRVVARIGAAVGSWPVDRWFFIRFDSPGWHVRARLEGRPDDLLARVIPDLRDLLDETDTAQRVSRWSVQTYRPEVDRYGGAHGLDVCHDLFHTDSVAAAVLAGEGALDEPELRWLVALRAGRDLLDALALEHGDQVRLLERARDRFRWEHEVGPDFVHAVGRQYRLDRRRVDQALTEAWHEEADVADVLALRRADLAADARRLTDLWADGMLNRPVSAIAPSLLHMTFNRFLRSEQRAQETVLYDYLGRALHSVAARGRGASG